MPSTKMVEMQLPEDGQSDRPKCIEVESRDRDTLPPRRQNLESKPSPRQRLHVLIGQFSRMTFLPAVYSGCQDISHSVS